MGRKSRAKWDRRDAVGYTASLTHSLGTWLERAPTDEDALRLKQAEHLLRGLNIPPAELGANREDFNKFSLAVYREPRWEPLHVDDWVIEDIIEDLGAPPIVSDESDPAFTEYLLKSLSLMASARFRRALAEQSRRFVTEYVGEGRFKEALAIEHNAYLTVMSEAATPLLVQMLVGGLARYYETHDEEEVDGQVVSSQ